jgi:hypothetical protein
MEEYTVFNMSVPKIGIISGGILAAWGLFAYVYSDMASITAMIPTFMGAPILLFSLLASKMPEKRKLFMHIAVVFGLLSALGGLRIVTLDAAFDLAYISHALLLIIGGKFTFVCVKSFIWIRKQREAAE